MSLTLALVCLGGVAALLCALARQALAYRALRLTDTPPAHPWPSVSIVIPARNEAQNIGRCVRALLDQDYEGRYDIVVVDDNSSDDTAAIVRALAADPRVRLISAPPLPRGWTGKPHACFRGAQAATGSLLCFLDADTAAAPGMLRVAVATAMQRGADMLTLHPAQVLGTFWERLLLPALFLVFAVSMDIRRINDPRCPDATGNGQFILFRRRAYEAFGGHSAVRGEILEDVALSRVVKGAGYRLHVASGEALIRTRMYTDLRSVWRGFAKNAVALLHGVPRTLLAAAAALALGLLPVALALHALAASWSGADPGHVAAWTLGCAALSAAGLAAAHHGLGRRYGVSAAHALLFPAAHALAAGVLLSSVHRSMRGANEWKGRVYSPGLGAAPSKPGIVSG